MRLRRWSTAAVLLTVASNRGSAQAVRYEVSIASVTGDHVTVELDYRADAISLSESRLVSDFGEILGTNLFLYQEGHLDRTAEVQLRIVARRNEQLVTLDTTVRERTTSTVHLSKAPNPDARAARLWQGLATGTVGN